MEQRLEVKVDSDQLVTNFDLEQYVIDRFDQDISELEDEELDEYDDWLDDYDPPKQCSLDNPGCESCQ